MTKRQRRSARAANRRNRSCVTWHPRPLPEPLPSFVGASFGKVQLDLAARSAIGGVRDDREGFIGYFKLSGNESLNTQQSLSLMNCYGRFVLYRTRFFGHKFDLSGLLHSGFLPGDTCVVRTA